MRTEPLWPRIAAATVLLLSTVAAAPAPAAAAPGKAAKRCPTVGRTLAVERYQTVTSRVWRLDGRTYGCTIVRSRPRTHLLTRAKTELLRLDDDTVAWTTSRAVGGVSSNRVWAYDLTSGRHFIRSAVAVPRRSAGDVPHEGAVEQLRVSSGFFVGWIANGDTVVIGADDPGELTLTGPDGAATPLFLDGDLAVAGRYDARPDLPNLLTGSLAVHPVPGDHGDSDDCAYSYETSFTWSTGAGQAFDARMSGTRVTPVTCG